MVREITILIESKNTREAMIKIALNEFDQYFGESGRYSLCDHSIRDKNIWMLVRDELMNCRKILLATCAKNKDRLKVLLEEDEDNPSALDCPAKLLNKANSTNQSAANWYRKCKTRKKQQCEIDQILDQAYKSKNTYMINFELDSTVYQFIQFQLNKKILARNTETGFLTFLNPHDIEMEFWNKIKKLTPT